MFMGSECVVVRVCLSLRIICYHGNHDCLTCSVNKVYTLLDEVGALDDRWSKVCSGLRALSTQVACTDLVARWQACQDHG